MKDSFEKIPLLFSILMLVLASFAFVALYLEINDNNRVAEKAMMDWKSELKRREDIKSLDRTLKSVAKEKLSFESHFAENSDIVPFLNTIEKIAGSVGTSIEITSVETPQESEVLLVESKSKGSFESLYKFLLLLENSPYELEITYAYMNRPSPGGSSGEPGKPLPAPQWELILKFKLLSFVK